MKRHRILALLLAAMLTLAPAMAFAQSDNGTSIGEPIVRSADEQTTDQSIDLQATYTTLNIPGTELYSEAFDVLDIVNQHRTAEGLRTLTMDASLLEDAMQRAAETVVSYSHTRPNGTLCFTISGKMMAENIATGQRNAAEVMSDWMNSPGHHANIMNSSYTSIGIGCYRAQDGAIYWVQCFSPSGASAAAQPADTEAVRSVEVYTGHVNPNISVNIPGAGAGSSSAIVPLGFRNSIILRGINAGEQGWTPGYVISSDSFEWSSSNESIMSVTADGTLGAHKTGTVTITGISGGLQIDIYLTVTEGSPFSDVVQDGWYVDGVAFASSNGLITGYSDSDRFGIGDTMTRAQMATILWRIAESGADGDNAVNTTGLSDVESNVWYTAAANWAVKNGVITGMTSDNGPTRFAPNDPITREQFAVILARFTGADLAAVDDSAFQALVDHDSANSWSADSLAWAVEQKLINGVDANGTRYLKPQNPVTREQAATILMNAYGADILP